MTAEGPAAEQPAIEMAQPNPESHSVILTAVGRQLASSTGLYMFATSMAIPTGIVGAIIAVQYLTPTQFGELGLLMVLASFLTVLYNVGLLHGTFLWVYGSSGEGGDDVEFEGMGQADVTVARAAMGTGMILTLIVVTCGTLVCFLFARPLAALLLGSPDKANLVGLAALSGGAGSLFRLTVNVLRFERRFTAYAVATIARPVAVLIMSTALIVAGYGVWGGVVGTAMPTIVCAIACVIASSRSYAWKLTLRDVREIAMRGGAVVLPVLMLFTVHNGDLYLLAHWVRGPQLGVYRLASRLGTPPSYFASAFMMTWSPLERSALVTAAFNARGPSRIRSFVNTYYLLVGFAIVVAFVMFARMLVLIAPPSYAEAAKVVPLIALAFVTYGAYIILIRTTRPDPMLRWYSITTTLSAAVFVASGFVLIPLFGIYGAPLAVIAGMLAGCTAVLILNARSTDPLPIEYVQIASGLLVSAAVSALALAGLNAGRGVGVAAIIVGLLAYVPALILVKAIPPAHVPLLLSIFRRDHQTLALRMRPDELPAAEYQAFMSYQAGTLDRASAVQCARLTRALRRLGGIGSSSVIDARLGTYLASDEPEAVRDFEMHKLVDAGVDAFELHRLDALAKAARGSRFHRHVERRPRRSAVSLRTQALLMRTRRRGSTPVTVGAATASGEPSSAGGESTHAMGRPGQVTGDVHAVLADARNPPPLAMVRALREIRESLGNPAGSPRDLMLARALWHGDEEGLDARARSEVRELRAALKLAVLNGRSNSGARFASGDRLPGT
jgi:O-antigen/teichoic acid export membrane protein